MSSYDTTSASSVSRRARNGDEIPTMTARSSKWLNKLYEYIQEGKPYKEINDDIISNSEIPAALSDVPPGSGDEREFLKHQYAATATILRKRIEYDDGSSESPNSMIDIATGGGKTLLTAIVTRFFLNQNDRNMAVMMVPDFPSNNTILKEINDLLDEDEQFINRQPPVYKKGDSGSQHTMQMFAHERFNTSGKDQLFHSACSKRLNRLANPKPPLDLKELGHPDPAAYIEDRTERDKHDKFNASVHQYFDARKLKTMAGLTLHPQRSNGHMVVNQYEMDWTDDERNLEWSRLWGHAFAYEDTHINDGSRNKAESKSKFQNWQYRHISSTGSGSMFTDVLKALCAGQEVLVIVDEFHAIYEDDQYAMAGNNDPAYHGGVKYRKRLQRFIEYLAIHPNVRLVILTATPAVEKDAMQVYMNTLVKRPNKKAIMKWFHGTPDFTKDAPPYVFNTNCVMSDLSKDGIMHVLHKVNGNLNMPNLWTGQGSQGNNNKLPICVLPPIPSEFFDDNPRQAKLFSAMAAEYEGILIYQHGPNRIQRTVTPNVECNSDARYVQTVNRLRTFFGSGVTFVQVGNKVCHLDSDASWDARNDRIGQHVSYKDVAANIAMALDENNVNKTVNNVATSSLRHMCMKFVTHPDTPSASSWFLRFLIKTVIAAFRLKYVRDNDQKNGSPCRTLIMIDEDFDPRNADPKDVDAVQQKLISRYSERAAIVLEIIKNVYEHENKHSKSATVERIKIVDFNGICKEPVPTTGELTEDDHSALIAGVVRAVLKVPRVDQVIKKENEKTTNITYIPKSPLIKPQVECILKQTPTMPPDEVAHIYVTSMAWKKSIDLKQFALQQIIASVQKCASAKQALGRIRRLNCMKGDWPKQDYSRLELYLDDANLNNSPFSTNIESTNALLQSCNTDVRPLISALFAATKEIGGIEMEKFEEFSSEYISPQKVDYSIDIGRLSKLETD